MDRPVAGLWTIICLSGVTPLRAEKTIVQSRESRKLRSKIVYQDASNDIADAVTAFAVRRDAR